MKYLKLILFVVVAGSFEAKGAELASMVDRLVQACTVPAVEQASESKMDDSCKSLAIRFDNTLRTITHARYVQAYASDMDHRATVWHWHQVQTIGVFILVVVIVVAALVMSFMQVKKGSDTSFEFGQSVKVSSNAIGLVTLVVAIVFFYLYVAVVYPLKESGKQEPEGGASASVENSGDRTAEK